MCTCLGELEKQLTAKLEADNEGKAFITDVKLLNVGFPIIDNTLHYQPVLEATYKKRLNGKPRPSNERTTLLFKYCPWCGLPYKESDSGLAH